MCYAISTVQHMPVISYLFKNATGISPSEFRQSNE